MQIEGEVLLDYPANMQDLNWNDLKVLLAVARAGGIAPAARALGVDDTTVSRRVAALSRSLGEDLLIRPPGGRPRLTAVGQAIAEKAADMERGAEAAQAAVRGGGSLVSGVVRVTATPLLTNRLLAPQVGELMIAYPDLEVELIPASRNLDLIMREADLALRLARPTTGGASVLARKIGVLDYGVFGHADIDGPQPWIICDDASGALPQARWLADRAKAGEPVAPLRIADAETALAGVKAGLGRTLLPVVVAEREGDLVRQREFGAPLSRDVWLLSHAAHRGKPAPDAVAAWLSQIMST